MDLLLKGKVVVVTGGAKGSGRACVELFAEEGARVVLADKDGETARQVAESVEGVSVVVGDLTSEGACKAVVSHAVETFGGVDILVNNAGFNDAVGLDSDVGEFRRSLDLNLVPAFELAKHCRPHLEKGSGCIINLGSKVSLTGQGSTSGYAASKGAINALTREWAAALAASGVRVNAVLPAECLTDQYERWFGTLENPEETRSQIEGLIPLGRRMTTPSEIAAMVVFLASGRSSHTTGQILVVDGGYTHLDRALSASHSKWS